MRSTSFSRVLSAPARATSSPATMVGFFGGDDQPRHRLDAGRIGTARRKEVRGLAGRYAGLLLHDVDRQRHEHRASRRLVGDLEGALQDRSHLVGALDLHAPFGDGRRDRGEVVAQHGIAQPEPRVLLAGRHDHRRVVLERAVDHADGVAQPGRHVQIDERRLAARLAVEIRGADRHALMQMHDVLELRIVEQRIEQRALGRAGIAEDAIDAVGQKRLQEHLTSAHCSILSVRLLTPGGVAGLTGFKANVDSFRSRKRRSANLRAIASCNRR